MYSRFKSLEKFEREDLSELKDSRAAIVGLGATGSVIAEHLARHGIKLTLIDRDYLEINDCYSSNLYSKEDCQKSIPKAVSAKSALNDLTEIESHVKSLKPKNIDLLESSDIILDGTDNMETRFIINDFSKKKDIPWIYTAALGQKGYSMFFDEKCFNCIFQEISPGTLDTCEDAGILREISSIAGSKSSYKAIKFLAGKEVKEELELIPSGNSIQVERSICEICEKKKFPHLDKNKKTTRLCGKNKYQIEVDIQDEAFQKFRQTVEIKAENDYLLRGKIKNRNITLFRSGRAIIEAEDKGHAEALFSEILGI